MCGIAGKLSFSSRPERSLVEAMTDEMRLRGPDAGGIYGDEYISLGHRRLAIIDLSESGNQPMCDHTGRYWIVFNGEIYNFLELRKELKRLGAQFRSESDTEVILEAYKAWGPECLGRMNGMFALGLWDKSARSLFLARDRLGKKPLFYAFLPDKSLVFASEVKALMREPALSRNICSKALSQFLSMGYILTDACILQSVKKLPPAHWMLVESEMALRIERYWDLAQCFRKKLKITEEEACEELVRLIDDATRLRMISDVPLGAFLSGGIDSSSIVAAMCRAVVPSNVHTFTIGFREKSYSEVPDARRVADALGVTHREQIVNPEMANEIDHIAYLADEPFGDNSMIPTYYLSKFARQYVTVALAGDGGDEIFAGYETYSADKFHAAAQSLPRALLALLSRGIPFLLPVSFDKVSFDYKLRRFLDGVMLPREEAHYSWREVFAELRRGEKRSLLLPRVAEEICAFDPFESFRGYFREVQGCHFLDQAMYVDIKTWLADDILVKADRMSMAQSLEVRAPLLDYRIVEFAAALPVELKLRRLKKKYILKESQRSRLPIEVIHKKKRGFNAPVSHWLSSSLAGHFDRLLNQGNMLSSFISSEAIAGLLEDHRAKRTDNSFKLYTLLTLDRWLENTSGGSFAVGNQADENQLFF